MSTTDNIAAIEGQCAVCESKLPAQTAGRRRVTCSPACKQELYRRRQRRRRGALAPGETA